MFLICNGSMLLVVMVTLVLKLAPCTHIRVVTVFGFVMVYDQTATSALIYERSKMYLSMTCKKILTI